MPLPKPTTDEEKDDFVSRCMSDDVMKEEYPDTDQRMAVCQSQWGNDMSDEAVKIDRRGYAMRCQSSRAEIMIYEEIGSSWVGGISAKQFVEDLNNLPKVSEITVRINSEGGSVFDGHAIYNSLRNHRASVHVVIDGLAASIASIIAMAGDTREIAENGFLMIHDPWMIAAGSADELRDQAEMMDKVKDKLVNTYAKRTGQKEEDIIAWMAAETWMDAQEAFDRGFVTAINEEQKMAALNIRHAEKFKHVPQDLLVRETPKLDIVKRDVNTYIAASLKAKKL
jgi:ATP-dependent Clp protease protease subunit